MSICVYVYVLLASVYGMCVRVCGWVCARTCAYVCELVRMCVQHTSKVYIAIFPMGFTFMPARVYMRISVCVCVLYVYV